VDRRLITLLLAVRIAWSVDPISGILEADMAKKAKKAKKTSKAKKTKKVKKTKRKSMRYKVIAAGGGN
jgi:hypothetical protein